MKSSFAGNAKALGAANGGRTTAFFKKSPPKEVKQLKKAVVAPVKKELFKFGKKVAAKVPKKGTVPSRKPSSLKGASLEPAAVPIILRAA